MKFNIGLVVHVLLQLSLHSDAVSFKPKLPGTSKPILGYESSILVPEGYDPLATLWATAFSYGYIGIQVTSSRERRILFSVHAKDANDRPKLIELGKNVISKDISGSFNVMSTFVTNGWKTGESQRLMVTAEFSGNDTIYSGYYRLNNEWALIARILGLNYGNEGILNPTQYIEGLNNDSTHTRLGIYSGQCFRQLGDNFCFPILGGVFTQDMAVNYSWGAGLNCEKNGVYLAVHGEGTDLAHNRVSDHTTFNYNLNKLIWNTDQSPSPSPSKNTKSIPSSSVTSNQPNPATTTPFSSLRPVNGVQIVSISLDNDSNSKLMFQDNEPINIMTNEARRFDIGKVLRVKAINETAIEIANFAPVRITDATILLTIPGQPKPLKLFHIKEIRAHSIQEIEYPFINGDTKFLDVENNVVDLSPYRNTSIAPTTASFDFTGSTDLIKKLKKLAGLKWRIKYHDYNPSNRTNVSWKGNPTPKDFRRFSGLIINMGYQVISEPFRDGFINEPITNNIGVSLTTEEKEKSYSRMKNLVNFNCGIVAKVSGLGGGSVFGVAEHVLRGYLVQDVCFITIHEVGHMVGYNHKSTMTYPSGGHGSVTACSAVWKAMLAANDFPIQLSNYYMPSDFQ